MKRCTRCSIEKPLDAFSPQAKGKFGVTSICKPCSSERGKAWHAQNRTRSIASKLAYANKNAEKIRAYNVAWRIANKERIAAVAAAWTARNAPLKRASTARRRAALLRAIPKWANLQEIKRIYRWAAEATAATGIKFQVDHLYPLQSDFVCGLHCWENLVIRTEESNKRKGNR